MITVGEQITFLQNLEKDTWRKQDIVQLSVYMQSEQI